jgi:hypothetical protein
VRVGPGQPEVSRSKIYQNPSKNQSRSGLLRGGRRAANGQKWKEANNPGQQHGWRRRMERHPSVDTG